MTDKEIMIHRFQHRHIHKKTSELAELLGMNRKDYEDAVRRGMEEEARERKSQITEQELVYKVERGLF